MQGRNLVIFVGGSAEEGVVCDFIADRCLRAVAGEHDRFGWQREEVRANAIEQLRGAAVWQIGAADRALEQHIADNLTRCAYAI